MFSRVHDTCASENHLLRGSKPFSAVLVFDCLVSNCGSPPSFQKMEDKLEEVLREFKSLRDRVILQDRRIARLEEQVAKVAL